MIIFTNGYETQHYRSVLEFVGHSEEHNNIIIAKYCLQHMTVKINDANVVS